MFSRINVTKSWVNGIAGFQKKGGLFSVKGVMPIIFFQLGTEISAPRHASKMQECTKGRPIG
jgi:hypothetical protein